MNNSQPLVWRDEGMDGFPVYKVVSLWGKWTPPCAKYHLQLINVANVNEYHCSLTGNDTWKTPAFPLPYRDILYKVINSAMCVVAPKSTTAYRNASMPLFGVTLMDILDTVSFQACFHHFFVFMLEIRTSSSTVNHSYYTVFTIPKTCGVKGIFCHLF